jgi:ABC-type branched-subunit amino acid transport system ATPase component
MPLLEVDDIHTFYGNIEALKGISLEVEEGEVVTLIGSNGAGKSTTLRSISGLTPPRTGTITFDGNDISATPPQDIVQLGISQSPEGRHCFQRMSVRENLELGAYLRRNRTEINEDLETVAEINRQGTTILLVEQNANFALEYSSRGYVLETGTIALADKSAALRENPDVQKAYLGT